MEVTAELTKVSLAPDDINARAVDIFLSTPCTNGMRSSSVGLAVPMGRPRYVNGIDPIEQLKM